MSELSARAEVSMRLTLKEALATIDRELVRLFGYRCKDFEITCSCCMAWRARNDLELVLKAGADDG